MTIYVDVNAKHDGNGSKQLPFRSINEAAKVAVAGDEVVVVPGIYREYVDPVNPGTEKQRIVYRSEKPLEAVITGAEKITGWSQYNGDVWTAKVKNSVFGDYNPYTTLVYGDWYFATPGKHTGCVWFNDEALYEAASVDECIEAKVYECSWVPEKSKKKWFAKQDKEKDETIFYANFGGADPNNENVEITVRRECFMPSKEGVGYITVSGFNINKAATTWAPPAAYQDGMISPHWSKGWIIEDNEIWGSKCAGICVGRYFDPENSNFYTTRHVKSPTQMERDSVCRGQYYGWLKEKIGGHIIRRNNIHHCEQGGIIGRMGGVFSIIEDNHIHHINNMMELGGAEIAGIKMHAAIDVIMRRNHIHHCTMGIWCDWEAQGTRITQNLLHDNQRPEFAKQLEGGMTCQDIFVEVSHGPTLIDNNVLLSDVSLRIATQGVAMVHNLCAGAFTMVGEGTTWRYTPYHFPHRTEVMGFMTILHGDDRIYNNIFVQKWPSDDLVLLNDSEPDKKYVENRKVGTNLFDEYPTYDEWLKQFDMEEKYPNMMKHDPFHFSHLPVWIDGNAYFEGARSWKNEDNAFVADPGKVNVDLVEKDGKYFLDTNIYEVLKCFEDGMISTDTLGEAFEPSQKYENPDGTPITFDRDYFGNRRGLNILPGPFVSGNAAKEQLSWS
ncbi:MAG: hypothetical protein E7308_11745 [Butyrivibrio sp.]|nr:hypothetical protein [Butyrivibrio sp.]